MVNRKSAVGPNLQTSTVSRCVGRLWKTLHDSSHTFTLNLLRLLDILQVLIILSTAFIGAFLTVNGLDYFLENGKVVFYAINVLHGKEVILFECDCT